MKVADLPRGAVVAAVSVPADVCDAKPGDLGVVFEPSNYYGDGGGPMVRWVRNGHACNVYEGWVEIIRA